MIERFIHTALKEGITTLQNNVDLLEDLFITQHGLSAAEFAAIRTLFAAKPPSVVHGYAHVEQKFPLYAIVLGSEGESQNFLGDDGGMVLEEGDEDYGADILTAVWTHSHDILVYAEHPDVTLYYYEIAKSILLAAGDYFNEQGMFQISLSGMDMAPDPRYVPEHLFLRRLTLKCQREFQRLTHETKRAFKISGIAVDSAGSPSDAGGVKTQVAAYLEGDE